MRIRLSRRIEMHFVAGNAGEFTIAKTGRRLHSVELAPSNPNHSIAPKPVPEKIRLRAADEIFLFAVIGRVWLNNEALREIVSARTEIGAVPIEIDLVCHATEGPDAMTLTTGERGLRTFQARGIGCRRIGLGCEMDFETANRIPVACNVFASLAVTGLARNPELGHLRIPLIARDKTRLALGGHGNPCTRHSTPLENNTPSDSAELEMSR
jgi:hypothetical protein